MGTISKAIANKILIFGFALVLLSFGISGRSTVQQNQAAITQAYLGCVMYGSDILECQDYRWGAQRALRNNIIKTPPNITIEDLQKATPPSTGQK